MAVHWIESPQQLAQHLHTLPAQVGLDTEFVRERTFWPQLALVQIALGDAASGQDILLVDPLPKGMTEALRPLLAAPEVLKVMHSASEDIVALQHACGAAPSPLFDTQIAAALCGLGSGLGYQKLVQEITGITVDKGETRSDWLRRPLSDSQLRYAADDVVHLAHIHSVLDAKLAELDRRSWLQADCTRLLASAGDESGERWPHLSMRSAQFLDPEAQRVLLRLLRWRDAQARETDKPRTWILDNEMSSALARKPPQSIAELRDWLERTPKSPRKLVEPLWRALTTPQADETAMPQARAADNADKAKLKKLQDTVSAKSAELGLPDGVLASRRWLEALMDSHRPGGDGAWPVALAGWRRAQLEPILTPLLAG